MRLQRLATIVVISIPLGSGTLLGVSLGHKVLKVGIALGCMWLMIFLFSLVMLCFRQKRGLAKDGLLLAVLSIVPFFVTGHFYYGHIRGLLEAEVTESDRLDRPLEPVSIWGLQRYIPQDHSKGVLFTTECGLGSHFVRRPSRPGGEQPKPSAATQDEGISEAVSPEIARKGRKLIAPEIDPESETVREH